MICKGRPLQEPVAIDGQPIAALLENLKHPVDGVRHRTRVELDERNPDEVKAALREWMKQFDPKKAEDAHPLLEALWGSSSTTCATTRCSPPCWNRPSHMPGSPPPP